MTDAKRPSLREAARRGVEAKQQAQAVQAAQAAATNGPSAAPAPPVAPRPAFQKIKPPVVGVEQVTVKCGHAVPFELFDLSKDKFRKDRRKKLTDRDCTACRVKAQEEKEAAEMVEARRRRQERAAQTPPRAQMQSRLPDGSRFDVAYDATKGEWSGTLTVPSLAPFTASASAVFKLLRTLDGMYRATQPAAT